MNTHKKKLTWLLGIGVVLAAGSAWAANTDTKDATITVTPVANVTMTLSNNTWAIGNQGINTSTVSYQAMTLTNTGDVDITLTGEIQGDDSGSNWVADVSSTTPNHYRLYVATSTARPNTDGSEFGSNNLIGKATGNGGAPLSIRGLGGVAAAPDITTSGGGLPAVDLWYRLDMPTQITTSVGRSMLVHYVGTAK